MLNTYSKEKLFILKPANMWRILEHENPGVYLNDRGSKIVLTTKNIARKGVQGFATGHGCI